MQGFQDESRISTETVGTGWCRPLFILVRPHDYLVLSYLLPSVSAPTSVSPRLRNLCVCLRVVSGAVGESGGREVSVDGRFEDQNFPEVSQGSRPSRRFLSTRVVFVVTSSVTRPLPDSRSGCSRGPLGLVREVRSLPCLESAVSTSFAVTVP